MENMRLKRISVRIVSGRILGVLRKLVCREMLMFSTALNAQDYCAAELELDKC